MDQTFNQYLSVPGIEGPSKNQLHYTQNKAGGSGVTIGRGLDLAKHSDKDLENMEISEVVRKKLTPYLGLTGNEAKKYDKKASPLTYEEYVDVIDKTVNYKFKRIEEKFNKDSKIGDFNTLPKKLQYMIGSVYYQMGDSNPKKTAKSFWKQVTTGDWQGLEENMDISKYPNKGFGMLQTVKNNQTGKMEKVPFNAGNNRRNLEWNLLKESGWNVEKLNQHYKAKSKDEASLIQNWKIEDNPFNLA